MPAKVIIYTTTICPYCIAAKKMLKRKSVVFEEVNLDHHPERWDECEKRSGRHKVPQIFFGDKHIGGCDDIEALNRSGEPEKLIKEVIE
jgi:glutaredoxin 3